MQERLKDFLTADIWRVRSRDLSRKRRLWLRPLRVVILGSQQFVEDKCSLRASALTFFSLMSLVPVLAMALGVSKGFGLQEMLEKQILTRFQGQEEIITWVTRFANTLLETTRGGVIAGVGVALLLWTVLRLLGNIEASFNHIWRVKRNRSFARKVSDYLSAFIICPLLLIMSSTVTVVIKTQVTFVVQTVSLVGAIGPAIFFALRLLVYCVVWILFTFVYMFMPNTRVRFGSALFAGIVSGTLYQLFQWVYIWSQIGVSKYNAVYGSLAALPLFLIWLQISWLIVLFGAELSFAHQNEETYEFGPDWSDLSYASRRLIALRITHILVKAFSEERPPLSAENIARKLDMPIRLVCEIIQELVDSKIVSEICPQDRVEPLYQPARDIDLYSVKYVIDHLEHRGSDDIPVGESDELWKLSECLKGIEDLSARSPKNRLLKDV
jgi:membrane protein